jgi:hypothetical protein
LNVCGDSVRGPVAEECDDGNDNRDDGCVDCTFARCGDGELFVGVATTRSRA